MSSRHEDTTRIIVAEDNNIYARVFYNFGRKMCKSRSCSEGRKDARGVGAEGGGREGRLRGHTHEENETLEEAKKTQHADVFDVEISRNSVQSHPVTEGVLLSRHCH